MLAKRALKSSITTIFLELEKVCISKYQFESQFQTISCKTWITFQTFDVLKYASKKYFSKIS